MIICDMCGKEMQRVEHAYSGTYTAHNKKLRARIYASSIIVPVKSKSLFPPSRQKLPDNNVCIGCLKKAAMNPEEGEKP